MKNKIEIAIFGAGCFWCTEAIFSNIKGVIKVTPGYAGGNAPNPTYEEVSSGRTGHAEVAKIEFDPAIIDYSKLLDIFWVMHNPTTLNRQGADIGSQYRSIILYTNENQHNTIEKSLKKIKENQLYSDPIVTQVKPLDSYYEAEDYHQQYYSRNPLLPYCQIVISPKLSKIRQKFATQMKYPI